MLSKNNLPQSTGSLVVPQAGLFSLPEKVLQFGTGVLLRGLPDYFIDKANRAGIFNGRIAVVKSTSTGPADEFSMQDGLYTLHVMGIAGGEKVEEQIVCSAISRVLSAGAEWREILDIAHSKELKVVISNTTEVGLQYVAEKIGKNSSASFPGKLLAFLLERYRVFGNDDQAGLVIIPTELVIDNGSLLKSIVLQLAQYNNADTGFMSWLESANHFCNSLVDRIVPGKPAAEQNKKFNQEYGYDDDLRIVAEPYSLWAIEGGPEIEAVLSFSQEDKGVVITNDIQKFRELKLRLLNGTHTLCCAVAILSGFTTVDEAMQNGAFLNFINSLMTSEIAPAIPYAVNKQEADEFIAKVLDRFSNPYIKHQWISISLQYSLKMRTRVVPLLLNYKNIFHKVSAAMALGFAAYIRFMKTEKADDLYQGDNNGMSYNVTDSSAGIIHDAWTGSTSTAGAVKTILSNTGLWGADLATLPGFNEQVTILLERIESEGMLNLLKELY